MSTRLSNALVLAGLLTAAFGITSDASGSVLFSDPISSDQIGTTWTQVSGTTVFNSGEGGRYQGNGSNGTIGAATSTAPSTDFLMVLDVDARIRNTGGSYTWNLTLSDGGTQLLTIIDGDQASGPGIANVTTNSPVSNSSHIFFNFLVTYNDLTGVGEIEMTQYANGTAAGNRDLTGSTSYGTIASFTGSFDISAIDGIAWTGENGADRLIYVDLQSVPEPGSLALLGLGGLLIARRRRA